MNLGDLICRHCEFLLLYSLLFYRSIPHETTQASRTKASKEGRLFAMEEGRQHSRDQDYPTIQLATERRLPQVSRLDSIARSRLFLLTFCGVVDTIDLPVASRHLPIVFRFWTLAIHSGPSKKRHFLTNFMPWASLHLPANSATATR